MADMTRRETLPAMEAEQPAGRLVYRQSAWTRLTHWIWAVALFFLLLSGLQIFNAHPVLYIGDQSGFQFENSVLRMSAVRDGETLKIDAALSAEGARFDLLDAMETAGPFGAGHPQPILALPRHRILDARAVGTSHLRVQLASEMGGRLQAMAFRSAETDLGHFLATSRGETIHLAGSIASNYWNGSRSVQFRILDAAKS